MAPAGLVGLAGLEQDVTESVQGVGLQQGNADFARHGQCPLKGAGGFLGPAEPEVSIAELDQDLRFVHVTRLMDQCQSLLEVTGRLLVAASLEVNDTEPGQREGLPLGVTEFAGKLK